MTSDRNVDCLDLTDEQRVTDTFPDHLLALAQQGHRSAVGEVLGMFRGYLKLLARLQLRGRPGAGDPSDLAQEATLRAFKAFPQFRGTTEAELIAWLRMILSRCLADVHRRQRAEDQRPAQIAAALDRSSFDLMARLVGRQETPSQVVLRREAAVLLGDALERLPADYREAMILRQVEGLPSEQVAERMGRSVASVRKLWARGLIELRQQLRELS
jgi:RNA polymerase sigma-70 factor (ECF subfamily)